MTDHQPAFADASTFADRHIGPRGADREQMLAALGYDSLDALVDTAAWISAQLGREPASRVARAVLAKRAKAACAS